MADSGSPGLRVFVALEGGGAKGLVHVGALKALESQGVEFHGLAGTSAGSIVAALKAAGFQADDLIDPVKRTSILPFVGTEFCSATDFFGPLAWKRIVLFRKILACCSGLRLFLAGAGFLFLFFGSIYLAAENFAAMGALVAVALWCLLFVLIYRFFIRGLTSVTRFRDILADTLRRKMFPGDPKREVLFKDFGNGGRPTLKIVATDLTRGQLKLFSPGATPGVHVADAVAASICLPVVFTAWELDGSLYFDGGLVSNLPAWTFDEERALDPDAMTIAIEIDAVSDSIAPPTAGRWLGHAVRTALFGASILNTRAVGNFEVVRLTTSLGLLAFDASNDVVFQTVKDATNAAQVRIVQRLFTVPRVFRSACEAVRELVKVALTAKPDLLGGKAFTGRLRAALAVPDEGTHRSLRLRFGVGYDTDADTDEGLLLPIEGSYVGEAFRENEFTFAYFRLPRDGEAADADDTLEGAANRWRRRLLRRDMAWLLCMPVRRAAAGDNDPPAFVVAVDCDQPIDPEAESFGEVVGLLRTEIETIFSRALKDLDRTIQ